MTDAAKCGKKRLSGSHLALALGAAVILVPVVYFVSLLAGSRTGGMLIDVPIPALAVYEGSAGVDARRSIEISAAGMDVSVSDTWVIANNSGEDAALSLCYPGYEYYSDSSDFIALCDGETLPVQETDIRRGMWFSSEAVIKELLEGTYLDLVGQEPAGIDKPYGALCYLMHIEIPAGASRTLTLAYSAQDVSALLIGGARTGGIDCGETLLEITCTGSRAGIGDNDMGLKKRRTDGAAELDSGRSYYLCPNRWGESPYVERHTP